MKKTRILNVMLALLALAAIGMAGCSNPNTVIIEEPNYIDHGPPPVDNALELEVNAIDAVELSVEATVYGFMLSWPPVKEANSYDIWRSTADVPMVKIATVSAVSNRLTRYFDIVSSTNTIEADTEYTYTVFAKAWQDQSRDAIDSDEQTETSLGADELLGKDTAKLPMPELSISIDGYARTMTYKIVAPELEDLLFPRAKFNDVTVSWKITKENNGTTADWYTAPTAINLLRLIDLGAAGFTGMLDEVDIKALNSAVEWDAPGQTMTGTYQLAATYSGSGYANSNLGYFYRSGNDAITEKSDALVYFNLFGYEDGLIPGNDVTFEVDPAAKLMDRVGGLPTPDYAGVYTQIDIVQRGKAESTYTLERWVKIPGAAAFTKDTKQPSMAATALTGVVDGRLLKELPTITSETLEDWTDFTEDRSMWMPPESDVPGDLVGDYFAPVTAADLTPDALGLFGVTAFDPIFLAALRGGTQYQYRLVGDYKGQKDWIETPVAVAAEIDDSALSLAIAVAYTQGSASGKTEHRFVFTPTFSSTPELFLAGDYLTIYMIRTNGKLPAEVAAAKIQHSLDVQNAKGKTLTWDPTANSGAGGWLDNTNTVATTITFGSLLLTDDAEYVEELEFPDADAGYTALYAVVKAQLAGKEYLFDVTNAGGKLTGAGFAGVVPSTAAAAVVDDNTVTGPDGTEYVRFVYQDQGV